MEAPTSGGGIALYAELLPTIQQVSLSARLPSPADQTTKVAVVPDGAGHGYARTVRVTHGALAPAEIRLPAAVQQQQQQQQHAPGPDGGGGGGTLPVASGHAALSWRLPAAATERCARDVLDSDAVPWSAAELAPGGRVACRVCRAVVVPGGCLGVWKDLPSENWAEMMEFWHCHKPTGHGGHGHGEGEGDGEGKGYGAARSAVEAQRGVGLVDLMTLLVDEEDSVGLVYSHAGVESALGDVQSATSKVLSSCSSPDSMASCGSSEIRTLNAFCSQCRTQLGYFNFRTSAVTLFKWRIFCEATQGPCHANGQSIGPAAPCPTTEQPFLPDASTCLAAALIASISRSSCSKSVITPLFDTSPVGNGTSAQPHNDGDKVLHLWTMNTNIKYSSSATNPEVVPAIKLVYRSVTREEADKMLEAVTSDVQEISLPLEAIADVARGLDETNEILPPSERTFRAKDVWKAGLLRRWDGR